MRNRDSLCAVLAVAVAAGAAPAEPTMTWTQLSLDTCEVNAYLREHPEANGQGVVIAVLDTGVDPSIPGLTRTPDGEVKVIDVQDFSGEGDTELHRVRAADDEAAVIEYDDDGAPIRYPIPAQIHGDDGRRYWFGWIEEKKFINASVPDLNDNGETDDRFAILVTAARGEGDDQAVAYVDTDLDRDFTDETPLRNYKLDHDTFTLGRAKPEAQIIPLTFAVNIFLRERKIVIHFDDGAHGTHVAGIAAGYRINNQDGLNGVAPGAKVISLKIGNNAIGGPSTTESKKKAMEYAARFARETGMPVVCNLSYGVESSIEGQSAIDKFYDSYLREYPYVVFCTSGGNEGPGLSSIGTPAAASEAITVGALLAADSARDVMGFAMDQPVVTVFSSRGGEVAKPDIAVPGWSTSTVPRWVKRGDFWAGTSMASPYAAGLSALLISGQLQKDSSAKVRAVDVKRALQLSAEPLDGFGPLDFGYGVPHLPRAADILDELTATAAEDPVLSYTVTTRSPFGHKGESEAAYWRSTWFPADERQAFSITPNFAPGVDAAARTGFARKFGLRSRSPWCKCPQESFYLRSEQSARVYVEYDAEALTEPGVHVGVVEAVHEGRVAFRLLNTVVVPHQVTGETEHRWRLKNATVHGWEVDRHFVATPPGTSAMRVVLTAPEGQASEASIERIFDPFGFQHRVRSNQLDTAEGRREVSWTEAEGLMPGVWEIDVVANRPDKDWPYDLAVRFFGLHADPPRITEAADSEDEPSGELTVVNMFDTPLRASADGIIEGFRMHKDAEFKGLKDELSYSVELGAEYSGLRLDLRLNKVNWAEVTDIAVAVEDANGKAIYDSAFSDMHFKATVDHPNPGETVTLSVKIRAGFAIADDKRETPIEVNIDHLLAEAVSLDVTAGDASSIDFVPAVPLKIEFEAEAELPKAPDGTAPVGYLRFRERSSHEEALRVPIHLEG